MEGLADVDAGCSRFGEFHAGGGTAGWEADVQLSEEGQLEHGSQPLMCLHRIPLGILFLHEVGERAAPADEQGGKALADSEFVALMKMTNDCLGARLCDGPIDVRDCG